MKKITLITAAVVVLFMAAGCASFNFQPMMDSTGGYINSDVRIIREGSASSRVYLGFFGSETFPTVERVAREARIERIATVTYTVTPGILAIWMTYTTTVTGE